MANDYFDPSTLTVSDGELAEAADINDILSAVEAAFDDVEDIIEDADVFFNTIYLGSHASAPTVDNAGDPVVSGAVYYDSTLGYLRVYTGTEWTQAIRWTPIRTEVSASEGQTIFSVAYVVGNVDVFRNGCKLLSSDFTATNGTSIVLDTPCDLDDVIEILA